MIWKIQIKRPMTTWEIGRKFQPYHYPASLSTSLPPRVYQLRDSAVGGFTCKRGRGCCVFWKIGANGRNSNVLLFMLQGKGLFAKKSIKKGDTIFLERPLVSAQFLWNALYKYKGEMSTLFKYTQHVLHIFFFLAFAFIPELTVWRDKTWGGSGVCGLFNCILH